MTSTPFTPTSLSSMVASLNEPPEELPAFGEQRRARLAITAAGVVAAVAVLTAIAGQGLWMRLEFVMVAAIAGLAILAARNGQVNAGGLLVSGACAAVTWAGVASPAPITSGTTEVLWGALALMVAGLTLPMRVMGLAAVIHLVALLVLGVANPMIPPSAIGRVVAFLAVMALVAFAGASIRDRYDEVVTERGVGLQRTVAALRQRKSASEGIVYAMPDAVCVLEHDGRIKLHNPAAVRILGAHTGAWLADLFRDRGDVADLLSEPAHPTEHLVAHTRQDGREVTLRVAHLHDSEGWVCVVRESPTA